MRRFEGRLFADSGILFLVVEANPATGVARVSYRLEGRPQVAEMPLAEVVHRLSAGGELKLDNLDGPRAAERVVKKKDGWFFTAREGLTGPFASGEDARHGLARHILSMQSVAASQ